MNHRAALTLWLMACPAMAGPLDDAVINTGSQLRDWCQEESQATLIGKGLSPFNWTASYWDQANTLMVKGQWRTDAANFLVECRVAPGAQARFASLTIQEAPT